MVREVRVSPLTSSKKGSFPGHAGKLSGELEGVTTRPMVRGCASQDFSVIAASAVSISFAVTLRGHG